jgi:putative nucleotidyltransferase with HDIG domain
MDGPTLLREVHARYPRVARIVLTGQTELEAALRAMPYAHQFLAKPCSAETLVSALERALGLSGLVSDPELRGVVGDVGTLPVQPRVFAALTEAVRSEAATIRDIARLVEQDLAVSANLLHVANSAVFCARRPILAVEDAVGRLGTELVRGVVLSNELFRMCPSSVEGIDLEGLQNHSQRVAELARRLMGQSLGRDEAFIAGLLHDVGLLILSAHAPEYVRSLLAGRAAGAEPLECVERRIRGTTHAELGAYLLGLWGMPYSVVEAVARHHDPALLEPARDRVASALLLADRADDWLCGVSPSAPSPSSEELASLGVERAWRACFPAEAEAAQ